MKKIKTFTAMVLILVISLLTQLSFAATKYDSIYQNKKWKTIISGIDQTLQKNQMVMDYLNLCINRHDLNKIIRSGQLGKEKSEFISKNPDEFLLYFQACLSQVVVKAEPTDAQFLAVTGIIKDPRAMAAKNGPEYEMEKQFLRNYPLYKFWEMCRGDRFLVKTIDGEIDNLYKHLK